MKMVTNYPSGAYGKGESPPSYNDLRSFYDVFHRGWNHNTRIPGDLRRLAGRLGPWQGKQVLDVGCGVGKWLRVLSDRGAIPAGIDISPVAIEACQRLVRQAELSCGPAESLPFKDKRFDVVTCLGSLEHFAYPEKALREMVRVAKPDAIFLFLVPNADFLPRRLGLYQGTEQARVREEARTLAAWERLFESAGLRVRKRWPDLHLLSLEWIIRGKWYLWPLRAAQAAALPFWPLAWQYQVYHLCELQ